MRQRMTIAALVCMMLLSVPAAAAPVTINVTGGDVRTVLLAVARMGYLPPQDALEKVGAMTGLTGR